jgi:hypothetical protein
MNYYYHMNYLPKRVGGIGLGVALGGVRGVAGTDGDAILVVGVGGVERVVTVDTVERGGHVESGTPTRTYT